MIEFFIVNGVAVEYDFPACLNAVVEVLAAFFKSLINLLEIGILVKFKLSLFVEEVLHVQLLLLATERDKRSRLDLHLKLSELLLSDLSVPYFLLEVVDERIPERLDRLDDWLRNEAKRLELSLQNI